MKFKVIPNLEKKERQVLYSHSEQSFDMDESLFSDFSIMLGCAYLGLDVSLSTSQVVNISGLCPKDTWINKSLTPPNIIENGNITIVTDSKLVNGTGIYLFNESKIYFDTNNKYCYIELQTTLNANRNIRFCKNAIISFCDEEIVGVWIQIGNTGDGSVS